MSAVCKNYLLRQSHQSLPLNRLETSSFKRVNSPGLPNCSFRQSCRRDKKKVEIGLVTEKETLNREISQEQFRMNSIQESPQPQSSIPKMEQLTKRNLRMIEKLESDKMCLEIFMSEEDNSQLIFTGVSKEKVLSPEQTRNVLLQNIQQLFNGKNQYMKLDSLEKELNIYQDNRFYNACKNQITQNDKSIIDKSLSISTIQEFKQSASSKMNKGLDIIEQGLKKIRNNQKSKEKSKQILRPTNCNLQKKSKSPLLKTFSQSKGQNKSGQKSKLRQQYSAMSLHI